METQPISIASLREADELIATAAASHGVSIEDLKISLWSLWFPSGVRTVLDDLPLAWIGKSSAEIHARYQSLLQYDRDRLVETATQQAQIALLQIGLQYKGGVLYKSLA